MMKREPIPIAKIYVPAKRRGTLDPKKAQEIAESILQNGQQVPILVRQDGNRFVLVEGLHRLEACRQLGEKRSSRNSSRDRLGPHPSFVASTRPPRTNPIDAERR